MDIYKKAGTLVYKGEPRQLTQYLRKRDFKIRFTDIDFANKIQERIVKFELINDNMSELDAALVDDQLNVDFYIEGRDFTKDGKTLNFTSLIAIKIDILRSEQRDNEDDKKAVITNEGRDYKPLEKEATDEELAGVNGKDELLSIWDQKKDKYGLPDKPMPGVTIKGEPVNSEPVKPEDDPFADIKPIVDIPKDLPF